MALIKQSREGIKLAIKRRFDEGVEKKYPASKLRYAAREVALKEIELIRKRTNSGLDKNGKQMRATSASYQRFKKEFIKNGYKTRKGKSLGSPTAFAADRPSQMMRLTGRMFSDMYVRDLKVVKTLKGWVVDYKLDFKTARSKKIAGYHNDSGTGKRKVLRPFWGAAKKAEESVILSQLFKRLLK